MLVKFSREGVKALEDFCHNGRVGDGGVRYIVKTEMPKKICPRLHESRAREIHATQGK